MIPPGDFETVARLATAALCGGAIGLERDLRGMPTGFRTLSLVALGAALASLAGLKSGDTDAFSRIAQGVVTGIGFLGAGVIFQQGDQHKVKGLTTAAAIWLTASIGLMSGVGELEIAVFATVIAVAVLMLDFASDFFWPKTQKDPSKNGGDKSQPQNHDE